MREGACLSNVEERTELNSARYSERLVLGRLYREEERMSAEKAVGSMDLSGLIILVVRRGLFLIGTEIEARRASLSETAGKEERMSDKREVTAVLEISKSRVCPES